MSEVMKTLMQKHPKLAQRMNEEKNSLTSNPIQILTSPSSDCPYNKCDGSGWIWKKDWSKRNNPNPKVLDEWKEQCECYEQMMKQKQIEKRLELSNVPPIFKNATVGSFNPNIYKSNESIEIAGIAKKAAANYVTNFLTMQQKGKGIYLYSKVKGSGKTRLASSVANALVKMYGVNIAFLKSDDLMDSVKNTFNAESSITEKDIIKTFREVDVLIIDDVAVEKNSDFSERILFKILDYRLERLKATIFTSNRTIDDIGQIYKEGRIESRIKKMAIEIYLPEESVRDEEAEKENEELESILFQN
ncbi:DnaA ATPase domain-containing protein [Niallia circulans]|uniref:ATP-binding protein n=2 Tax=Niallia circulans TaxID=1397 RepID=UPI001F3FDD46|nr:ATP-binding protein [Niallia circulans]MED3839743.1 ATP-binding protein [Niallia circulans]MED4241229.1 ATP-binding protein [Niallia circulans]MED4247890.1 ATP-binding protein [Niallia circulans]